MLSVGFTYICPYTFICLFDKAIFLKIFVLFTHLHSIYIKPFLHGLVFLQHLLFVSAFSKTLILIGLDIKLVEAKKCGSRI